jgi:hypothetical protein
MYSIKPHYLHIHFFKHPHLTAFQAAIITTFNSWTPSHIWPAFLGYIIEKGKEWDEKLGYCPFPASKCPWDYDSASFKTRRSYRVSPPRKEEENNSDLSPGRCNLSNISLSLHMFLTYLNKENNFHFTLPSLLKQYSDRLVWK